MKITRQVVLDLLPLYAANEVSKETRDLIEKYLETDPQLAKIAKQLPTKDMMENIPVPLSQDSELETYRRVKRSIAIRTVIIAVAIAAFLMLILLMFFTPSSSNDRSCTAAERMAPLKVRHELAMKVFDDRCEINRACT